MLVVVVDSGVGTGAPTLVVVAAAVVVVAAVVTVVVEVGEVVVVVMEEEEEEAVVVVEAPAATGSAAQRPYPVANGFWGRKNTPRTGSSSTLPPPSLTPAAGLITACVSQPMLSWTMLPVPFRL